MKLEEQLRLPNDVGTSRQRFHVQENESGVTTCCIMGNRLRCVSCLNDQLITSVWLKTAKIKTRRMFQLNRNV